jgi:hypothetical protein
VHAEGPSDLRPERGTDGPSACTGHSPLVRTAGV